MLRCPLETARPLYCFRDATERARRRASPRSHPAVRIATRPGSRDTAVVFDFHRYRTHAVNTARVLAESGVRVVAVTDGPLSPLVALTDTWCELIVPAVGPFDSSVPAVAMAELFVASVAGVLREDARERIDRTEELWEVTGVFVADA